MKLEFLETERLRLMAGTADIAYAAVYEPERFARLLRAAVPGAWPPAFLEEVQLYYAGTLALFPDQAGWWGWYILRKGCPDSLVGSTGFKGTPLPGGIVEIGYSLVEDEQGKGYATEAVTALVGWAFASGKVQAVMAEAGLENVASIRVLEKSGFHPVGQGSEEGLVRYLIRRGGRGPA